MYQLYQKKYELLSASVTASDSRKEKFEFIRPLNDAADTCVNFAILSLHNEENISIETQFFYLRDHRFYYWFFGNTPASFKMQLQESKSFEQIQSQT